MFDSNSENLGNKRIGFMLFDYFTYHVYKHVFSNIPGAEFILGFPISFRVMKFWFRFGLPTLFLVIFLVKPRK